MTPDPGGPVEPRIDVRLGTLTSQRPPRACSGNVERVVISLIELSGRGVAGDRRRAPTVPSARRDSSHIGRADSGSDTYHSGMRRRRWLRAAVCSIVLIACGCVGAVERDAFEQQIRARGGGLVDGLPAAAFEAVRNRLGTGDIQAGVVMFVAPESSQFRLVLADQPEQVTRFLADHDDLSTREPAVHLRVRSPQRPSELDDYSYRLGAVSAPRPVRVSAFDDLDGECFSLGDVPGLTRLESIVDTARARSGLADGVVPVIVVSRFGRDIRIVADVTSARSDMIAEFDSAGSFLRIRQV
jgi:hypothetical protein